MKKVSKIILTCLLITITLSTIILLNKKEVKNNGMFAIMLETSKGTGKYNYAKDNKWPQSDEYVINMYKTYCEKGSVLRWNNETKKINATVKGTDKCYVYFDLSEYGTEEHPYLIQTIEDLVRLSNEVNNGTTYAGTYFLLTNDLDFQDEADYEDANRTDFKDINGINGDEALITELTTGSGFNSIGKDNSNYYFQGTFDGGNKEIANLYMENSNAIHVFGLFGCIKDANIRNLTLSGRVSTKYISNMGGLIGEAYNSIIENCHNKVNVTSTSGNWSTGGVLGTPYNNVTITNCTNTGNITGGAWIGGIVGGVGTGAILTINDSSNLGIISKTDNVTFVGMGGLIGAAINASEVENIVVKNSYNIGELKISSELSQSLPIGGLIGQTAAKTIINESYNTGNIKTLNNTSLATAGGLVGLNSNNITIEDSYNKGEIVNNGGYYSGGLLGRDNNTSNQTKIINCNNSGNITSNLLVENYIYLGGMAGYISGNLNIENSYNSGEIKNEHTEYSKDMDLLLGGLIGRIDGSGTVAVMNNSYNKGNIIGGTKMGGIVGIAGGNSKKIVNKCYNLGNIISNTIAGPTYISTLSGIIGYNSASLVYILNSYNMGNINSPMVASGIAYEDFSATLYIFNSYNAGNLNGRLVASGLFTSTQEPKNSFYAYNTYNIGNLISESGKKYGIFVNRNSTVNTMKAVENVYYENSVSASNIAEVEGKPMAINDMKSPTFVDELNKNVANINLGEIEESLKDYTLSKWTLGSYGYPTLINE